MWPRSEASANNEIWGQLVNLPSKTICRSSSIFVQTNFILFSIIPISLLVGSAASSINIVVISLSFLIYIFYLKEWKWLKNKNIKLLIFLYFYLIFNSFISLDFNISINRNFGFIIYIIFFVSFNYFFFKI